MREHKYRAWDKNLEFMIDPGYLHLDGSGLVAVFYQDCDDEDSLWVADPIILENIELLEYTGLKDKNGIEIYEGDRVELLKRKTPDSLYLRSIKTIVKWSERGLNYNIWKPNDNEKWEVIGNIYENKELLK